MYFRTLWNLARQGSLHLQQIENLLQSELFYTFKIKENKLKTNPADDIKTPRAERKEVDFLSIAEVEELTKTAW